MATEQRALSLPDLAREANVPADEIEELAAAGYLRSDRDGRFVATDIGRVRLAHALRAGGLSVDDIVWASESTQIPLNRVAEMFAPPSHAEHTFAEFGASLGERGANLPAIYAAFGLATPPPDSPIPADEERLLARFLEVWTMIDDTPEVAARAAHITGDGVRRIAGATMDLFDARGGSPPDRLRRGLSQEESMAPAFLLPGLQSDLMAWLDDRHTEHEVFERIVGYIERAVATAGRSAPRAVDPPAIAFVDLAGFTELTSLSGDERAAEFATTLHVVASRVVTRHGGRVVKQLGDGVLIRFDSARGAVPAIRELMAAIVEADLPPSHAAIAVGRFVVREGDVYGQTVNLAARMAAHALPGELLMTAADASAMLEPADRTDAGTATFKGIPDPVALARIGPVPPAATSEEPGPGA